MVVLSLIMSARLNKTALLILSTLSFLYTLGANYLINTASGGKSVADISDKYLTLFTPADYAFAIWGLIYLQLIAFLAYHWVVRKREESAVIERTGIYFAVANVANGSWIIAWIHEYLGLSVLIMIVLLIALIKLVYAHRLEIWDAPVRIIFFIWWPICFYLGWIILATVANISAWLVSLQWSGAPVTPEVWTFLVIIVAMLIYLLLTRFRNMREASLVGIWGLVALAVRHWEERPAIAYFALAAAMVLLVSSAIHGFRNRQTSPFLKWRRGEV